MATVHGIPGEWARVRGTVLGLWPLFLAVFAAGFSAAFILVVPPAGAVCFVLSLVAGAWCLRRGLRRIERFFKGARGEERVSAILRGLPDGYHVFNDFHAAGRRVDHVVIGPAGVFSVETKFWRGRITVEEGHILLDGQLPDRDPIAQALRESAAVRAELAKQGWTGPVAAVLAFASDTFAATIAELQGVVVLNSSQLHESFATGRAALSPVELERLVRLVSVQEG